MSNLLAINGGEPVRTKSYPAWPEYDEREREGLLRVLESRNWWANQGVEVKTYEEDYAKFTGAKNAFRSDFYCTGHW